MQVVVMARGGALLRVRAAGKAHTVVLIANKRSSAILRLRDRVCGHAERGRSCLLDRPHRGVRL